jgi:methyltransferase family protein
VPVAYLSPAFSPRTDDEIVFLRGVDERTDFVLFWHDIVRPALERGEVRACLEIGADRGDHTRRLAEYCTQVGGRLVVVDPVVAPELRQVAGSNACIQLVAQRSDAALAAIQQPVGAVFLQGDRNYHVVLHDLRAIAELARRTDSPFPMVFLRGLSWPYGRRDMYYQPDEIPVDRRQPFARDGMHPFEPGLRGGLFNAPYANAVREGGPRNGVATAVEDFIASAGLPLTFVKLPMHHGFGALFTDASPAADFVREALHVSPQLQRLLEVCEIARLNIQMRLLERGQLRNQRRRGVRGALGTVVRKAGSRLLRWIGA